jgi:hypothetical protein
VLQEGAGKAPISVEQQIGDPACRGLRRTTQGLSKVTCRLIGPAFVE